MGIFSRRNVGIALQAGSNGLRTYLQTKQQNDIADERERMALIKAQQDEIAQKQAEEKARRDEEHQQLADEKIRAGMENTVRDDLESGMTSLSVAKESATPESQQSLREQAQRLEAMYGDTPGYADKAKGLTPDDIDAYFGGGIRKKRGLADVLGAGVSVSKENSFGEAAPKGMAHTPAGSLMQKLSAVQGGMETKAIDYAKILDEKANVEAETVPTYRQLGFAKKDDYIKERVLPGLSDLMDYAPPGMSREQLLRDPTKYEETANLMRGTIEKTGDTDASNAAYDLAMARYDQYRKAFQDEKADMDSSRKIKDGLMSDLTALNVKSFGGKIDPTTGVMAFQDSGSNKQFNDAQLYIPRAIDTLESQGVDIHEISSPMLYALELAHFRQKLTPGQTTSKERDNIADFPSDSHMKREAIDFLKIMGLGNDEYVYDKDTGDVTVAVPGAGFVYTYKPEEQVSVNKWSGTVLKHIDDKPSPKKMIDKIKEEKARQTVLGNPPGSELKQMAQNSEPPAAKEDPRKGWTSENYKADFAQTASGNVIDAMFGRARSKSAPQIDKDAAGPPMTADENRRRSMEAYQNPDMIPGFGSNMFDGMINSRGTSR